MVMKTGNKATYVGAPSVRTRLLPMLEPVMLEGLALTVDSSPPSRIILCPHMS